MSTIQKLYIFVCHFMFLSLNPLNTTFSSARSQGEALIQWKNSLVHSPTSVESWSVENINNLCNWTSVACDGAGMVSELNLLSSNINGTLTELDFTSFSNLTRFDVKNNSLNGRIPVAIGSLSKACLPGFERQLLQR